jgi:DUF4097 and DUF4098 domain-containing protein YvlB
MRKATTVAIVLAVCACAPPLAFAQRFPFERSFDAAGVSTLDVSTIRGRIEIVAGEQDRIVVAGAVTVRIGWDVPADAPAIAARVAGSPPIERVAGTLQLRPPSDPAAQRAVTVDYQVRVPPHTTVRTSSNSGATTVRGLTGPVEVRTQSGAIDVTQLGGGVSVTSGSGAVNAAGIGGPLNVVTTSSAVSASGLGASLAVRTQSGQVDAAFTGAGDADVETGSSAIRLHDLRGGLAAKTQSGRITIDGAPGRPWTTTTGSSSVSMVIDAPAPFSIDAASRSGAVAVEGGAVAGSVDKHEVKGSVGGGGPLIRIRTGSGSIRVHVDDD